MFFLGTTKCIYVLYSLSHSLTHSLTHSDKYIHTFVAMKEFLKRSTSGGAGSGSVAGEFKQRRYGPAVKGKRKRRRLREEQRVVEAFSGVRQSAGEGVGSEGVGE